MATNIGGLAIIQKLIKARRAQIARLEAEIETLSAMGGASSEDPRQVPVPGTQKAGK